MNLESMQLDSVATLSFDKELDTTLTDKRKVEKDGLELKVVKNAEYEEQLIEAGANTTRNVGITSWTVEEVNLLSVKVKIVFSDVKAVSQGGISNLDELSLAVKDPSVFRFKRSSLYLSSIKEDREVTPVLQGSYTAQIQIPRQADMNDTMTVAAIQVSERIEETMDTVMIGSFVTNVFVSVSMKQILKAIKVFQVVSFFSIVSLDYPPSTLMFL